MMSPITARASDIRPPPPRPWMARKAISCSMLCEKPASREPAMNVMMAIWKSRRRPYRSEILPHSGVDAGAIEQAAVLELPDVPAHGRGVEAEHRGDRGEPHRALVGEQLEDRERRVVEGVAGLTLAHPPAERHEQTHEGVLGRVRCGNRLPVGDRG